MLNVLPQVFFQFYIDLGFQIHCIVGSLIEKMTHILCIQSKRSNSADLVKKIKLPTSFGYFLVKVLDFSF